jgi:hypothetical protein
MDLNIGGSCKSGLNQSASLVGSSLVMRRNEMHKITLGLVRDHFNKVSEEFTFRIQFDNIFSDYLVDGDSGRHFFALLFEFHNAVKGFSYKSCELFLSGFDMSLTGFSLLGIHEGFGSVFCSKPFEFCPRLLQLCGHLDSFGIGDIPHGIIRNNAVIHQGRQGKQYAAVGNVICGAKQRGGIIEQSEIRKQSIHSAIGRIGIKGERYGLVLNRHLIRQFRIAGNRGSFRSIARHPRRKSGQFWVLPSPIGEPIKMGLLEPYVRRFEFKLFE